MVAEDSAGSAVRRDGEIVVGGTHIEPGTRQVVRVRVTQDLDGGEVALYVHAIRGTRPGPTLAMTTAQHGDEWFGPLLFRHVVEMMDPSEIKGTVLMVPVANPVAFGQGQRNTQHESDGPDMNRAWPGIHTWHAELMTKAIAEHVLRHADTLLDFHPSPWGSAMGQVVYGGDFPDEGLVERCHAMGLAFGWENLGRGRLVQVFPGPRSIRAYAGLQLGVQSLVIEIGGSGFSTELERSWIEANRTGIRNVMTHIGMLDGTVRKRERVLLYRRTVRVNPSVAGLLVPTNDPETLMREVSQGEVLGRIVSPYTFETLEELVAPCDGWLVFMARSYPIRPGHWAFGVAVGEESEWITP
jgi:uncharacterized protein